MEEQTGKSNVRRTRLQNKENTKDKGNPQDKQLLIKSRIEKKKKALPVKTLLQTKKMEMMTRLSTCIINACNSGKLLPMKLRHLGE